MPNEEKYLTFKQIQDMDKYPFDKGAVRGILRRRYTNGLANIIIKIGKTLCVREDVFDEWLHTQTKTEMRKK